MNDSKEFQDAESVRTGNSHVTSRSVSFPPHPIPEGTRRHSFGMSSRGEGPPSIWDTHGISGTAFANPVASLSAPYLPELNQWSSSIEKPLHSSTVEKVKGKNKIKIRDASLNRQPKIQSSSVEETLERIMGQTNNDCRFRIFTCRRIANVPARQQIFSLCTGRKIEVLHLLQQTFRHSKASCMNALQS